MTTFQAFVDDSGSGKPVFVLSGYISRLDWWEDFSDRWQSVLDEPPKLKYFKMREAATLSEQFGRMKATIRNERIKKLFALIRMAAHASIVVVVPIANYEKHIQSRIDKDWDDPYFLALFDAIIKLLWNQVAVNSEDVIEFIFDHNARMAAVIPFWYQAFRKRLPPKMAALISPSPKFEDDKDFLPLQAGDAQSWYIRRLFAERFWNTPFRKDLPKETFSDLDIIPTFASIWTKKRCEQFVTKDETPDDAETQRVENVHDLLDYLEKSGEL